MPDPVARARDVSLVELLDQLMGAGVAVSGDVTIGIAGIDLVYLGVRALLASVGTIHSVRADDGAGSGAEAAERRQSLLDRRAMELAETRERLSPRRGTRGDRNGEERRGAGYAGGRPSVAEPRTALEAFEAAADALGRSGLLPRYVDADPENVQEGLARLVLTLVELLRQLMERQAIRRIEAGDLTEDQIERMGQTFQLLAARMEELKDAFGLAGEDLTLNLGPLGNLR